MIRLVSIGLLRCLAILAATATVAWAAPPPLSPYAGDVKINEIQTGSDNTLLYVELYFVATTDITNWTLNTNGPGGAADSSCTLPAGSYDSGTFLIVDADNCLDWHPEQREIYILDDQGHLVHYVSLWHSGNQDKQGDFGDPADFPAEYDEVVTDLNDQPSDHDNYCADTDGSSTSDDWNSDGETCEPTQGESNMGAPLINWRMDESYWDGTPGEVLDSSGNGNTGTANGGLNTEAGLICLGGNFDGVNDYIQSTSLYAALRGTATLSFWIRTTQTGAVNTWQSPGVAGVEQSGGTDDIFWGWLDENGHIGVSVGNDNTTKSTRPINDDSFHHIVLSRDALAGTYRIYIDGTLDARGAIATGDIGTSFASIGRIHGSEKYFQGQLDELLIFGQVLTDAQVRQIYDNQSTGKNYDGQVRDLSGCTATVSCFSDSFDSSLGSDWQTMNSSGSFGNPRVVGNRLRLTDDTGNVATAATLLRQFPSAGNRLVVEFDYYAYKNNGGTNAADGITLTLSDRSITPFPGSFGGSLGYAQRNNGDAGFNGGWLGIGLDEYGNFSNPTEGRVGGPGFRPNSVAIRGSGTSGYRYLSGTAANLDPTVLTTPTTPQRYRLTVDHTDGVQALVSVERDASDGNGYQTLVPAFNALTQTGQAAIPDRVVLTLTGSTGGSSANHEIDNLEVCANVIEAYDAPIHHFELVRNQASGLTCEPLDVALRACADEDCTTEYTGTFDATLSPVAGWAGGNTPQTLSSNDIIKFLPAGAGTYTLDVPDSDPSASPLSQTLCFIGAATTAEANCDVTFNDTGLRFFPSDNSSSTTAYFDLVAGADEGPFSVQAVETNTSTGVCEALFTDGGTLDFSGGTECSDPGTCSDGQQVSLTNGSTSTVLPNPENQIGGASTTTIPLTFDTNSTVEFTLNSPDVGVHPLTLEYELPDADGNPSGNLISHMVNLRVQPAELRLRNIVNSAGDTQASGIPASADASVFTSAGELFRLDLQALNALGNATPNFGRTNTLPTVNWEALTLLEAPAAGSGTITDATPGGQWEPTSDTSQLRLVAGDGLSFSDLGVIQLQGRIESYLGTGGSPDLVVDSDSQRVGRFVPAYITATQLVTNSWGATSYRYQSQPASLSPMEFAVQAFDMNDNSLNNYDDDFFKLEIPETDLLRKPTALINTGSDLLHPDLTWTRSDDGDFDGTLILQSNPTTLTWYRKATLPDANDLPQILGSLRIEAASLTDTDGICHDSGSGCSGLDLAITPLELSYARVNAEHQAAGSESQVILPVWVEVLGAVDTSSTPTLYDFGLTTLDNETDGTVLTGLDESGQCSPAALDCTTIAGDATLTGLSSGEGYFTVDNDSDTAGIAGVIVQSPDWLTWAWDETHPTTMSGPPSTLYFGQYQGRQPILFRQEGFR